MLTTLIVAQALGITAKQTKPDVLHGTHLAIHSRCIIKANHVEDYGHKGSGAREGVNL